MYSNNQNILKKLSPSGDLERGHRARTITLIVVHCSATPAGRDVKAKDIDRWHRQQGWKCIGYHYVIDIDGTIEKGRPEAQVGAHCKNHNAHSIGVCYIGGEAPQAPTRGDVINSTTHYTTADTRTDEQKKALLKLLKELKQRYPKAIIVGHKDLDPKKSCPCFDAVHEYKEI